MQTRQRAKTSRTSSHVWDYMYEIYENDSKVDNVFFCTNCHKVIYNGNGQGNTNDFLRHICHAIDQNNQRKSIVHAEDKKSIKEAAVSFVAKDLRPYSAIEGEGLLDLCGAVMKFGKTYKTATINDLHKVMPSRNTVRSCIKMKAKSMKSEIKSVLEKAKEVGGFAITSDTWTDQYRRVTYICLVAHCNVITDEGIKSY